MTAFAPLTTSTTVTVRTWQVAVDEVYEAWRERLPSVVAAAASEWDLQVGEPFTVGQAGWAAPATLADGTEAVLKVSLPHREARGEAAALRLWDGQGAVRLLRHDAERWALLLERCRPGTRLVDAGLAPDEALTVAGRSLVRLWSIPPTGAAAAAFETVADVCAEWAGLVRRRMEELRPPFDPGLVALGASLLEDLPRTATGEVVVHGDFNPGNLLAAEREPWLAIDPKPMVGDPGYDAAPMVEQIAWPGRSLRDRFAFFAGFVGEPVERLLAWSVARNVESALWEVSVGRTGDAVDQLAVARRAADSSGA